jgi:hypothetical protein
MAIQRSFFFSDPLLLIDTETAAKDPLTPNSGAAVGIPYCRWRQAVFEQML